MENTKSPNNPLMLFLVLMVAVLAKPTNSLAQVEPVIEIEIYQHNGGVTFEFFINDTLLFFIPYKARVEVSSLRVTDSEEKIIWSVSSLKTRARQIKYGVVPEGFRQIDPQNGIAPALNSITEYWVRVRNGRASFVYGK